MAVIEFTGKDDVRVDVDVHVDVYVYVYVYDKRGWRTRRMDLTLLPGFVYS